MLFIKVECYPKGMDDITHEPLLCQHWTVFLFLPLLCIIQIDTFHLNKNISIIMDVEVTLNSGMQILLWVGHQIPVVIPSVFVVDFVLLNRFQKIEDQNKMPNNIPVHQVPNDCVQHCLQEYTLITFRGGNQRFGVRPQPALPL